MSESNILQKYGEILIVVCLAALSLLLNLWNNNFFFGHHFDEDKKIGFVQKFEPDFHHPVLMIHVARTANRFFQYSSKQDIVRLGRTTTAVFGALMILFLYYCIRGLLPPLYTYLALFVTAATPVVAVHAHYFKEDIIYTCFAVLSLCVFFLFLERPVLKNALYLGAAAGLAVSSQYKGFLLWVIFFCVPVLFRLPEKKKLYKFMSLSFAVAGATFLLVNYPMFYQYSNAAGGMAYEINHILEGHLVKIDPFSQRFTFHLRHSLKEGITVFLLIPALAGILWAFLGWRRLAFREKIFLAWIFLNYFVIEIIPTKPFPDFMRYVIPITPFVIYFAVYFFYQVARMIPWEALRFVPLIVLIGILAVPLYDTVNIIYYLDKDTRDEATAWMRKTEDNVMCERYVFAYSLIDSLADYDILEWKRAKYDRLVASSFMYQRYLFAADLPGQDREVYRKADRYKILFRYPYKEIKPEYKTFAFSNPTIRIIDIRD